MDDQRKNLSFRFSVRLERVIRIMKFLSTRDTWWSQGEVREKACPEFDRVTVYHDLVALEDMELIECDPKTNNCRWSSALRFTEGKDAS